MSFFFQAEDGIRDLTVTGVQTCALPILGRLASGLRDGWTITRREFGHVRYEPGQLLGALIFPGVMVILFGYVFGSAIAVPGGGSYREYLMPGLFAMASVIGMLPSALMVSKDVAEGGRARVRSL